MASKDLLRRKVWTKLREVAVPDSRFRFDFSMYIPDFEGSSECTRRIREMDLWKGMRTSFITPDNCLIELRKWGILDGKTVVLPTYGLKGPFFMHRRDGVPEGQEDFAATLDGTLKYGRPIGLAEIKQLGHFDMVVTGASAVNLEGVRYGKGHGYFDLEWGMFSSIGVIDENTPLLTVVHDCQVIDQKLPVSPYDSITDYIITPTRIIKIERHKTKPKGVLWNKLRKDMLKEMPPLQELKEMQKRKL